jgi:hypothetical protein
VFSINTSDTCCSLQITGRNPGVKTSLSDSAARETSNAANKSFCMSYEQQGRCFVLRISLLFSNNKISNSEEKKLDQAVTDVCDSPRFLQENSGAVPQIKP